MVLWNFWNITRLLRSQSQRRKLYVMCIYILANTQSCAMLHVIKHFIPGKAGGRFYGVLMNKQNKLEIRGKVDWICSFSSIKGSGSLHFLSSPLCSVSTAHEYLPHQPAMRALPGPTTPLRIPCFLMENLRGIGWSNVFISRSDAVRGRAAKWALLKSRRLLKGQSDGFWNV